MNPKQAYYDKKIQYYNRLYRVSLLSMTFTILIFMGIGVRQIYITSRKIDVNVQNTKSIIENNQQSTLEARKANIDRIQQNNAYIKCLGLITYDHPEFLVNRPTREQVEAALDKCAKE